MGAGEKRQFGKRWGGKAVEVKENERNFMLVLLYYVQVLCPEVNRYFTKDLKTQQDQRLSWASAMQNYVHIISVKEKYSEQSHPIKQTTY